MKAKLSQLVNAFLILSFTVGGGGDRVIRKDGRAIEGTITSKTNASVVINSNTGQLTIPLSDVANIEQGAASGSSPITQANYERQKGNYEASFKLMREGFKTNNQDSSIITTYQNTFNELYNRAKGNQKNTPDSARKDYLILYNEFSDPLTVSLLGSMDKANEIKRLVSNELAYSDYLLAERMITNVSMKPQAMALLNEAVTLTGKQNADYLLAYGNLAYENQQYNIALDSYNAIVNNPSTSERSKQLAYDRLSRVEKATGQKVIATPTPVITPQVVVAQQHQIALTTPQSANSDQPLETSGSKFDAFMKKIKMDIAWNYVKQYLPDWNWDLIILILGYAIGVILFLWYLPYKILSIIANRGNTDAANAMWLSKKIGILAFIPFLFKTLKKPSPKKRCQFCGKGIDNVDAYSDFNFSVCPHCREPINPIYDLKDYVNSLISQLKASHQKSLKGKGNKDVLIEKDAMLRLVRSVIALTISKRASDFHLETESDEGKARARIDGIMYELVKFPREIATAFISALKVMANLDITERRVPQDGKISFWYNSEDYDLRINTSPAAFGEKVVIRVLSQKAINIKPNQLGMDGINLDIYLRNISKPHGVVIVTGPSGAGKSTTLYVALNVLNNGEKNIVTIEDPIEYKLKGLSQMQVNPGANFTFATGLRSILRQDPDVIMVGEIRDKETAEAALDAATTGHTVFTTLHTIDAPTAFSRMKDLGIETARMAGAVTLVIAQRLVRTICPDCRTNYTPTPENLKILGLENATDITYVHGKGCQSCMNTGYMGRIAVYEMLETTEEIRRLLETNAPATEIRDTAKAGTMRTLRDEGIKKIRENLTTVEEVIRVTTG